MDDGKEKARVGTAWGEFTVQWDKINGGVRFSMLECPNAVAWTITTGFPPDRDKIVLHLTINRMKKHHDFIQETNNFLDDWSTGIENNYGNLKQNIA